MRSVRACCWPVTVLRDLGNHSVPAEVPGVAAEAEPGEGTEVAEQEARAVGVWGSREAVAELPRQERRFEPRMGEAERARKLEGWREAVGRVRSQQPGVRS